MKRLAANQTRVIPILLLLLFVAQTGETSAQQEETSHAFPLKGTWMISYLDDNLGPVSGKAFVGQDESSVRVTLRNPATGAKHELRSTAMTHSGNDVTIVLRGSSPFGNPEDGLGFPQVPVVVPEGTGQVTARYGRSTVTQQINPRKPSDLDLVTVKLQFKPNGNLSGQWEYRSDPVYRRDTIGRGRAGGYVIQPDGTGLTYGSEVWRRPEPQILGSIVVEDQLARVRGVPSYKHPFQVQSDRIGTRRTILVFGNELPVDQDEPIQVKSLTDKVRYDRVWRNDDISGNDYVAEIYARGIEKLRASLTPEKQARLDGLDFLMLRAETLPGVVPGIQSVNINGAETAWFLKFGDNVARADLVRKVPTAVIGLQDKHFEASRDFFYPETIHVRVVTELNLGVDKLMVALGINGRPIRLGGNPKIPCKKIVGLKNTYVSAPIRLKQSEANPAASGRYELQAEPGFVLTATIAEDGLISIPTGVAKGAIHRSPGSMTPSNLWKDYLRKAAMLQGEHQIQDWDSLPRGQAASITNKVVFAWHEFETNIKVGDHAAMLLLRDTYIEMMREKEKQLAGFTTNAELNAFRDQIEPFVWDRRFSLYDLNVPGHDGSPVSFGMTYVTSNLSTRYNRERDTQDAWVLESTRTAIQSYRKSLAEARAVAEGIKDSDIKRLVGFTGTCFDAVARVANTRMMRLEENNWMQQLAWAPDMQARGWIARVSILRDKIRVEEQLARSDTKTLLLGAAIASWPAIMFAGSAGVVGGVLVDVVDLAYTTVDEIQMYNRREAEILFARTSAEVIGPARVQAARKLKGEWHKAALTIFFSAGGVLMGADDFVDAIRALRMARVQRGAELIPKLQQEGIDALTKSERRAVYAFVEEAHHVRRTDVTLTSKLQREALEEVETLDRFRRALGPSSQQTGWVAKLDGQTFDELKQLGALARRDLDDLMTREGDQVATLLTGPDGDLARQLLKWHPYESASDLQRAIESSLKELQAAPGNPTRFHRQCGKHDVTADNYKNVGWEFDTTKNVYTGRSTLWMSAPGNKMDKIERSFDPNNGQLVMHFARRDEVPGWITGAAQIPLDAQRGIPSMTYANLRMMNDFGIDYGANVLKTIKMSTVHNARSIAQLNWVAKTYHPGKSFDELVSSGALTEAVKHSRSVGYARSIANLAGFEVTAVRLANSQGREAPIKLFRNWFGRPSGPVGDAEWATFLRRHEIDDDTLVHMNFDIYLSVRPKGTP